MNWKRLAHRLKRRMDHGRVISRACTSETADHMHEMSKRIDTERKRAALWKRLAKTLFVSGWTGAQYDVLLYRDACRRLREAEAERDARRCCGNCAWYQQEYDFVCRETFDAPMTQDPWHSCASWKARGK